MTDTTRRSFMQQSAALGVGLATTSFAVGANDKIGVAVIGVRGQGNALLKTFAAQPDVNITHICDIDEAVRAQRGAEAGEGLPDDP